MRQTVAIIFSLFLVFLLGMWGQYVLAPAEFKANIFAPAYQVIMLFALGGDWTNGLALPWQLELARFLAPVVSVAGVLIVLTRGAWVSLTNLRIRFWQGHVVVVGLGEKGWQFAQSCAEAHKTVAIERDEDNPYVERARSRGIKVIVGDILDEQVMRSAGVHKARHLVTFCGNDGASVEIAIRVREYLARIASGGALRIHLHVNTTQVSSRLDRYAKFYDAHRIAEVDFFSVYELSARILLKKYPPDQYANAFGQKQVHIALYGFGLLAEQILMESVRLCHFLNARQIRFTVFDKDVDSKLEGLLRLYPGIAQLADVSGVEAADIPAMTLAPVSEDWLSTVTEHVICMHNDADNLDLALGLRARLEEQTGCNSPINVRMQHASGLARLLESRSGEPEVPDGLYPFGMFDEVLFHENILVDLMDELAQAIHEDYLMRRKKVTADRRLYSALNEWRELPQPERKSSRLQGDHLATKLRAVRCRYSKGPANDFAFTDEEAELLARMEHNRWRANKIFEGWSKGEFRIEGARVNPFNDPWDQMDPAERAENIEAIKRLPELLQTRLGWRIQRECYIGVTGHRPHRLDVTDEQVLAAIDSALESIMERHPDRTFILVSPLAEGADRMLARAALDQYHMALQVPLPLPFELYRTDFESEASLDEFKALVGRAEFYFELPMRFGNASMLAARMDGNVNEARDHQYALAGAYIAQMCDEMIAIFDGGEANGKGGTADVIKWRTSGEPPVDYRNDADFFSRPVITKPIIIESSPVLRQE